MSPQHMAQRAYSQAFHTVGKTRQVVMLYDGAIRFLKQAKEAMEQNKIEQRFKLLTRTSDIILGLQSCLDFDKGEGVAKVLYDFYSSVDARILTLHRTSDPVMCEHLIAELKEMRDIWDTIDKHGANPADTQKAAAAATEPAPALPNIGAMQPSVPLSSDITV